MILYQSPAEDYYALCGMACLLLLREWLTDPAAIGQKRQENGGNGPYLCFFCGDGLDPAAWGAEISASESELCEHGMPIQTRPCSFCVRDRGGYQ